MTSIPRLAADEKKIYQEITAIFCLFLGVFLLLSLVSYIRPIFAAQAILPTAEGNWCGGVGFYTAFYLFSFVGVISFFPVILLFYVAVAVFTVSATLFLISLPVAPVRCLLPPVCWPGLNRFSFLRISSCLAVIWAICCAVDWKVPWEQWDPS